MLSKYYLFSQNNLSNSVKYQSLMEEVQVSWMTLTSQHGSVLRLME